MADLALIAENKLFSAGVRNQRLFEIEMSPLVQISDLGW